MHPMRRLAQGAPDREERRKAEPNAANAPRGPFRYFQASNWLAPGASAAARAITPVAFGGCKHLRRISPRLYSLDAPMGRALVLNASDQPLAVVTAQRAVVLVLKDKAEVVHVNGLVFRAERIRMEAPSVVRLRYFVKVPFRTRAPLTRRAVFARDGWACQYCGAPAENLDHVIPKSRGGEHSWENVVAACRRCNARKENHLPSDIGLRLRRQPFVPSDGFRLSLGRVEPGWEPYLV
jgi:5-methylcytosine-specific restriction endonuclease McrA